MAWMSSGSDSPQVHHFRFAEEVTSSRREHYRQINSVALVHKKPAMVDNGVVQMRPMIITWLRQHPLAIFFAILVFFLALRLSAAHFVYHQDEYKWAEIVNPVFNLAGQSVHPPLPEFLFSVFGKFFGYENLRFLVIAFGAVNLLLIFTLLKRRFGLFAAALGSAFYTISVYAVLASLQIDIDGSLLPFFILLSLYFFENAIAESKKHAVLWWGLFVMAMVFGFLTKLSFILWALALLWWQRAHFRRFVSRRMILLSLTAIVGAVALAASAIVAFHYLFKFDIARVFEYARSFHFLNFGTRNYFQLIVLVTKSVVLFSPLFAALVVMVLTDRETRRAATLWTSYAVFNLIFYLVLFDFSDRTIERYFMVFIIPAIFIFAPWLAKHLREYLIVLKSRDFFWATVFSLLAAAIIFGVSARLPYKILPLNPKIAYVTALRHFDFSFLLPITSGSGPIGFYFPAREILAAWILTLAAVVALAVLKKPRARFYLLTFIFAVGIFYHGLAVRELLLGTRYGSPDKVARQLLTEVVNRQDVPKVVTYNDVGGYELGLAKKYERRFYTSPMFLNSNRSKFPAADGYFMVLDFPQIDQNGPYGKYLKQCGVLARFKNKEIIGLLYDCRAIKGQPLD
ncbi:MAG: PMT 2 protein [Candidatus Magasanikbacteria bacterium]|nr:PMT 2 protein [Candidatus Magasanikbacteria bacterium]